MPQPSWHQHPRFRPWLMSWLLHAPEPWMVRKQCRSVTGTGCCTLLSLGSQWCIADRWLISWLLHAPEPWVVREHAKPNVETSASPLRIMSKGCEGGSTSEGACAAWLMVSSLAGPSAIAMWLGQYISFSPADYITWPCTQVEPCFLCAKHGWSLGLF